MVPYYLFGVFSIYKLLFSVSFDLKVILQEAQNSVTEPHLIYGNEKKYNSKGLGPLYLKISLDHVDSNFTLLC